MSSAFDYRLLWVTSDYRSNLYAAHTCILPICNVARVFFFFYLLMVYEFCTHLSLSPRKKSGNKMQADELFSAVSYNMM